jgi:hypothetical protein
MLWLTRLNAAKDMSVSWVTLLVMALPQPIQPVAASNAKLQLLQSPSIPENCPKDRMSLRLSVLTPAASSSSVVAIAALPMDSTKAPRFHAFVLGLPRAHSNT